ncbi:MAG: NAD-dependent epimerase/dehydratase family protein [Alphaproteobacteria bacterium]|nr:NAD-dependent epimerase/dehydratase family protein [Alphaproteobacteria bacterium]
MARVLVTGATGFVGRALCPALVEAGYEVVAANRGTTILPGIENVRVGPIDGATEWNGVLDRVDTIIHLAGRVHVMRDPEHNPLDAFRRINVQGTQRLAEAATRAGVRRLVFLSSIKVNGEYTTDHPFTETDLPAPIDAYGISKWEAEQDLNARARAGELETTVLRSPLIYGPGVKGNLYRLLQLCDRGLALPLGGIVNKRSLISLNNLVSALRLCVEAPRAAGKTYLVSDGEDISTSDLIQHICEALGQRARLLPAPQSIFRLAATLGGQAEMVDRLLNSLMIDHGLIERELGWQPREPFEAGINQMADWYRRQREGQVERRLHFVPSPVPAAEQDDVSVVMVTYNTGDAIRASIDSVLCQRNLRELIIVDNGNDAVIFRYLQMMSKDPRITLISGHGNVGFSRGCNIGAQLARGKYLLLLNPDCVLEPDTFPLIIDSLSGRAEPWMATVRVVNSDGSEQRGCRRTLASPQQWLVEAFRLYLLAPRYFGEKRVNLRDLPCPESITPVPAISGAFMFMRRDMFFELDGLDPAYFLHFEDLDFCMRLTKSNGRIFFFPQKKCLHIKGTSDVSPLAIELYKARGLWLYFRRFYSANISLPVLGFVWGVLASGLIAKGLGGLVRHHYQHAAPGRVSVET